MVATPLGNLADMSLRALAVLKAVDVLFCEDTRVTGTLLKAYGIQQSLKIYHQHNAQSMNQEIAALIEQGKCIGLVSDAGMPAISDPGESLVAHLRNRDMPVTVIPGPSAGVTALVSSGLSSDQFQFVGFLPQKEKDRQALLHDLKNTSQTLIFYEAPHRLLKTLDALHSSLGNRRAAVARELTKKFEELQHADLKMLQTYYANIGTLKGEFVIVVEGAEKVPVQDAFIHTLLEKALEKFSTKEAAQFVSDITGESRKTLYQRALEMKDAKTP